MSLSQSFSIIISLFSLQVTVSPPFPPDTASSSSKFISLFDSWSDHVSNSCSYLDRVSHTSDQLSEEENDREIERAIDEIIKYDFMNIYKKVTKKEKTA